MKLFTFLSFIYLVIYVQSLHQTQERFLKESSHCYDFIASNNLHANQNAYKIGIKYQNYSRSMETFINLVEKVESYYAQRNKFLTAERLIRMLLKRYHIDGLYMQVFNVFQVTSLYLLRDELTDILLGMNTYSEELNNLAFTDEEHCILHYMLSRFIMPLSDVQVDLNFKRDNRFSLVNDIEEASNQINKLRINSKSMQFKSDNLQKCDFYEQGVVRFCNSEYDAIEVSRILTGILVGLTNNLPKINNYEILEKLKQYENFKVNLIGNVSEIKDKPVDILLMLTLADISSISLDFTNRNAIKLPKELQVNAWNSQICPIFYQWKTCPNNNNINLKPELNEISLAQLRGGLDGIRLGQALKNKKFSKNQLKLSQILKMYYSPIRHSPLAFEASICSKSPITNSFRNSFIESTIQYAQLTVLYLTKGKIEKKSDLKTRVLENNLQLSSKLADANSLSDESDKWCNNKLEDNSRLINNIYNVNAYRGLNDPYGDFGMNFNIKNQKYPSDKALNIETNNDIIFMVDFSNSLNNQLNIINKILGSVTMYNKETVTILTNRPGKNQFKEGLDVISWRSPIKEKSLCNLKNLANTKEQSMNSIIRAGDLIDRISFTLTKFKNEQHETMIAGKVFILFNFGFIKHDQSQEFLAAKRNIYIKHRDIKFIVIGQGDRNDLRNLIDFQKNSDENVFTDNLDLFNFNVNKLIHENPAIITYKKCNITESRFSEVAEINYVSPNAVKYYVLSPQYFIGSSYFELRIDVPNNRQLKACISRNKIELNENFDELVCKSTAETGNLLEFYLDGLCDGYTNEQCQSVYLALLGLTDKKTPSNCFEFGCLNPEQIKFELSHNNMICNSSFKNFNYLQFNIIITLLFFFVRYLFEN